MPAFDGESRTGELSLYESIERADHKGNSPDNSTENKTAIGVPTGLTVSVSEFLSAFHRNGNPVIRFRALPAKIKNLPKPSEEDLAEFKNSRVPYFAWREKILKPFGLDSWPWKLDRAAQQIADPKDREMKRLWRTNANADARGVYFVVNGGGHEKNHINKFTAFFFEIDDRSIDDQWTFVSALPVQPHVIVKTRSSLHVYWLADDNTTGEEWETVQRTLILFANSDPQIRDRSRVMRVPGFDHTTFDFKTGETSRVPVELLRFDKNLHISASEMLAWLEKQGRPAVSAKGFDAWLKARNIENKAKAGETRSDGGRAKHTPALFTEDLPKDLRVRYSTICAQLGAVEMSEGETVRAECPCCADPNPSFVMTLTSDKILMFCHAQCTNEELCSALGIKVAHQFAKIKTRRRGIDQNTSQDNPGAAIDAGDLSPEGIGAYADEIYSEGGAPDPSTKPIYAGPQDPAELSRQVWPRLLASEAKRPTLFNYNNILVRIEASENDPGHLIVKPITVEMLTHRLARLAQWWKRGKDGEPYFVPPPLFLVKDMLASPLNDTGVPVLRRITAEPVLDRHGKLINTPGFHPESGIYYTPRFASLPVPERPTKEQMIEARDFLLKMIEDFPFEDDASRDNALAIGLTPQVREMIDGPLPLGFPTAAVPRTGKTKLLKITLGKGNYQSITYSANEEEMRKRITSCVMSGFSSVIIDNIRDTLDSAHLASLLTGDVWNDRLLGTNQNCMVRPTIQWTATANNPRVSGEIQGRILNARIVAKTDRPELRTDFEIKNIERWAADNRPQIVQAYLTMASYWISQGRPPQKNLRWGGYESYLDVVGGIMQACGLNLNQNYVDASEALDPERAALGDICNSWWNAFMDSSGKMTTPQKAGSIWEKLGGPFDGLSGDVRDSQGLGYYLGRQHERRIAYSGPSIEQMSGQDLEELPQVHRLFVIRKSKKKRNGSSLYELHLESETSMDTARVEGVEGVEGVGQPIHTKHESVTAKKTSAARQEKIAPDPVFSCTDLQTPLTPTTPTGTDIPQEDSGDWVNPHF